MSGTNSQHRIVILGGGFGGVYTAMHLERLLRGRDDVSITLVSRDNYFLVTPLLFEAGSGVLDPRHAVTPIRKMLDRAQFDEAEIERVDFERNVVVIRHGPHTGTNDVPFDQLVFALGGVTNTHIVPGSEHARPFKTLAQAIELRNHIIDRFEEADLPQDFLARRKLMSFVVVGAGLVGVELMGELTGFVKSITGSYRNARQQLPQFHLIEHGPRILPEMDHSLGDYAKQVLERRGVRIHCSSPAAKIEPGRITLKDGATIDAETFVLAVGVAPNPLLAGLPLELDRKGRIAVDPTMRSKSRPNVWALGDCASIPDPSGKPYPQLAQHALREAKVLARNIAAVVSDGDDKSLKPFVYETLGTLAALGHFSGVGRIMRIKLRGFIAWWVWRTYYLMQMPRFERKLRIVLDWTIALFFKYDVVKLDFYNEEDRKPIQSKAGPT